MSKALVTGNELASCIKVREMKTGKSYTKPTMANVRKELKVLFPDKSNSELSKLVLDEYKTQEQAYIELFRDVEHNAKQAGYLPKRFSITETNTMHKFSPVYGLDKPKVQKAKTQRPLKLNKTDIAVLDSLLEVESITDAAFYVNTVANRRNVDAQRIESAVMEYISQ